LVVNLHKDFINAGAEAITLNSYSVTPQRLKRFNLENMFEKLQKTAIKAAFDAVNLASNEKDIKIIGCLPPLVMSYKTSIGIDVEEAKDTYKRIIGLQEPSVDIFCCETICSIEEAKISTEEALKTDKKVWLSFCVKEEDGTLLRSGERLEDALKEFDNTKINSFLVNCAPPEAIHSSIKIMKNFSKPFGAMPNAFETVNNLDIHNDVSILKKRSDLNIDKFVGVILSYVKNNASIVGGCCEVGPQYIEALKNKIFNN
jgi:S-methylmethionine-dependent homocysteine/selenocysteine methylase